MTLLANGTTCKTAIRFLVPSSWYAFCSITRRAPPLVRNAKRERAHRLGASPPLLPFANRVTSRGRGAVDKPVERYRYDEHGLINGAPTPACRLCGRIIWLSRIVEGEEVQS